MRLSDLRPDQNILVAGHEGYRGARTAPQSFPAASVTAVTVTWPVAFPDMNYTFSTRVIDDDGSGQLIETSASSKTATGVTVTVQNGDQTTAHMGHVEAIAVHD